MMYYIDALRNTTESAWVRLSIQEKTEALQAIEKHIADSEGRAERIVRIENMNEGYYGYYNHGNSGYIQVSPFALETSDEAVKTVLHEGRHAYQHDCLDHNTGFPQPILDQFQEGFDHYTDPEENIKAYANNFTETDAESFALQQSRLLDIEREAVLSKTAERSEDNTVQQSASLPGEDTASVRNSEYSGKSNAFYMDKTEKGYDWENQTTFPELGREAEKVKGGSEKETIASDLRDVDMSREDLQQYYDYFTSQEVAQRPMAVRQNMGTCLQNMGHSIIRGDEEGYKDSRGRFLDMDAIYRTYERDNSINPRAENSMNKDDESHDINARKAPDKTESTALQQEEKIMEASRSKAVEQAWAKEADRVRNGRGTWDWTVEQQAEMLERGRVSGFEGSHMLSVKDYPEHAGNPDNIQLIPTIAHYDGVHERNTSGDVRSGIYDAKTGEIIPVNDGKVPELPEIDLTDRYDPGQREFHNQHPEFEQSGLERQQSFKDTKERHPEKSLNSRAPESERDEPLDMSSEGNNTEAEKTSHDESSVPTEENKGTERGEPEVNTEPVFSEEAGKDEVPEENSETTESVSSEEIGKGEAPEENNETVPLEGTERGYDDSGMNMEPAPSEEMTLMREETEMPMEPAPSEVMNSGYGEDSRMNMEPEPSEGKDMKNDVPELNMAPDSTEKTDLSREADEMNMEPQAALKEKEIGNEEPDMNMAPKQQTGEETSNNPDRGADLDESHGEGITM